MILINTKKIVLSTSVVLWILLTMTKLSYAADDAPLFSLDNTNFVVSLAFIAFVAILLYFKVHVKIASLLDDRSRAIEDEINNANLILEESKTMLADLEREHKLNIEKAKKIVSDAEAEAEAILNEGKKEIRLAIERKVQVAEDQIKATEASVIRAVKNKAIDQAISRAEIKLAEDANPKISKSILEDSLKNIELGLKRL